MEHTARVLPIREIARGDRFFSKFVFRPRRFDPDKIFEEATSGPPAATVELPRGTWVGTGVRSLTEPGMWVDGQKENEESLRVTLRSPGFGSRATVRAVIDGGEKPRAGWTSRVEIQLPEGALPCPVRRDYAEGEALAPPTGAQSISSSLNTS